MTASGRTLIFHTADRITESLVGEVAAHELIIIVECPEKRECFHAAPILRRCPEVGADMEIVEFVIVEPAAARKGSKTAAVGGAHIR